jgi:hypothetical protein
MIQKVGIRPGDGQRPLDVGDAFFMAAGLMGGHAPQVPGIGMVGLVVDDLAIDVFRLRKFAALVMTEGDGQRFGNSGHGVVLRRKS